MRKALAVMIAVAILAISGCVTVESKRPSPVATQSDVDPKAIITRLEKDYGSPVSFEVDYTEINGQRICIEKYWYKIGDTNTRIVVIIDNGKICRMYTTDGR